MSPKPITCQIDSTINVSIADQAVGEQDHVVVADETEINPTDAMELRVKNKDGTDSYKVGDEARLSIEVKSDYEFGSSFAEEFKYEPFNGVFRLFFCSGLVSNLARRMAMEMLKWLSSRTFAPRAYSRE